MMRLLACWTGLPFARPYPACRRAYAACDAPNTYTCYCGKETDPSWDPWRAPHSCGEVCGKPLGVRQRAPSRNLSEGG